MKVMIISAAVLALLGTSQAQAQRKGEITDLIATGEQGYVFCPVVDTNGAVVDVDRVDRSTTPDGKAAGCGTSSELQKQYKSFQKAKKDGTFTGPERKVKLARRNCGPPMMGSIRPTCR